MGMSARVELTDDELILLDGACTDEVQSEVDKAKLRIAAVQRHTDMPAHVARLVADAVAEGVSHGRLLWQPKRINRRLDLLDAAIDEPVECTCTTPTPGTGWAAGSCATCYRWIPPEARP
jgi:hypothetical protein